MATLLYLTHRMPYPPNKGDKVRSYHLLKHLVRRHRVFLGTFLDDPDDEAHIDSLRALCSGLHVTRLHPARARLGSLAGLLDGEPLTLHYYRDRALDRWVRKIAEHERIDAAVVFSSTMAQYSMGLGVPTLVDFVDVDSAKWTGYAERHRWPLSSLYRREGARLLTYERAVAARSARSFFVTEKETALFRSLSPETGDLCEVMCNGVDAEYFAPDGALPSPYDRAELPVVFTGAMDYWPNIDAVTWFAAEMLPRLRAEWPALRFHIVGRNPAPAVLALDGKAVNVTGTVPDVRPYLQHAAVVVAPLRVARGIQNKILEAMAMARPVVAASDCVEAISAKSGAELIAAFDANAFVRAINDLLHNPARAGVMARAGRLRVQRDFSWDSHMGVLERHLALLLADQPLAA